MSRCWNLVPLDARDTNDKGSRSKRFEAARCERLQATIAELQVIAAAQCE